MKVENTDWELVNEGDLVAVKCLDNILMKIRGTTETLYQLQIGHSFKMFGNSYYILQSKDIESACKEANTIAKNEFKEMTAWYAGLYKEVDRDKSAASNLKGTIHSSELTTIVDLVCSYCGKNHDIRDTNGHLISEEGKDYVFERKNGEEYCICTECQKDCNDKGL